MEADFWLQRWQEGQIGFHRGEVMALLETHWPALRLEAGSRVLVPLAGKSLDMHWLAARGHRVLGVELSPLAVQQFFAEAGLQPVRHRTRYGEHFVAGPVELILGDAFALDAALLVDVAAVYDRAALIALTPVLRQRYLDTVYAALPGGCEGLLITLEYPQPEKAGPPFSVDAEEVARLFDLPWHATLLERRDILGLEPRFQADGVSALDTAVYRLQKS
ncbi:MAG: thiopurine S-methyltransferase [Pseudoxanthomonas sp.]